MAGTDPTGNFDAAGFRSVVLQTMLMGLPNTVSLQPTFRWNVEGNWGAHPTDQSGVPYDFTATPSTPAPMSTPDLQVTCAVQYMGGNEQGTVAGFENSIQIKVTLLDTQYDQLISHGGKLPDGVIIANQLYNIDRAEQVALFTVDVYTLYCTAQGEA